MVGVKIDQNVSDATDVDVVILTGAGASVGFGLPDMLNFISNILKTPEYENLDLHSKELLNVIQTVKEKPDLEVLYEISCNLEAIHNTLTWMAIKQWGIPKKIDPTGKMGVDFTKKFNQNFSIILKSAQTLRKFLDYQVVSQYRYFDQRQVIQLYKRFFQIIESMFKSGQYAVFTTNYDRTLESYFNSKEDISMINGFSLLSNVGLVWNSNNYSNHINEKNKKKIYYYYKLHGSIGWYRDSIDVYDAPFLLTDISDQTKTTNVILYPSQKEFPDIEPFLTSHVHLGQFLSKAKCCVIIGFSMRDKVINNIFEKAISQNRKIKILLIDPNARNIRSKLEEPIQEKVYTIEYEFRESRISEVKNMISSIISQ
jgi:NAD-dependent SIR2 family protein deacetylase